MYIFIQISNIVVLKGIKGNWNLYWNNGLKTEEKNVQTFESLLIHVNATYSLIPIYQEFNTYLQGPKEAVWNTRLLCRVQGTRQVLVYRD